MYMTVHGKVENAWLPPDGVMRQNQELSAFSIQALKLPQVMNMLITE